MVGLFVCTAAPPKAEGKGNGRSGQQVTTPSGEAPANEESLTRRVRPLTCEVTYEWTCHNSLAMQRGA